MRRARGRGGGLDGGLEDGLDEEGAGPWRRP
jgi:hypothetical protein